MLYPAHTDGSHRTPHPPLSSFPARTPLPGRPPPLPLSAQRLTAPCRSPHALSLILGFRELQAKLPHMPINTRHRPPYKTPNARPDHYRLRQTDIIRSPHGSFPALAPRPFAHLASPLPLLALLPTTPCPLTPLLLPCAFVRPLPPAALCPFAPFLRAPLLLLYRLRSPCPPRAAFALASRSPAPRLPARSSPPVFAGSFAAPFALFVPAILVFREFLDLVYHIHKRSSRTFLVF